MHNTSRRMWGMFFVVFCLAPAVGRAAKTPQRPNVLFILCDDIRWNAMSCAGHPALKTPHIDRIAQEGVRFRNMFCTTSLCSPSRASILTGLYPAFLTTWRRSRRGRGDWRDGR